MKRVAFVAKHGRAAKGLLVALRIRRAINTARSSTYPRRAMRETVLLALRRGLTHNRHPIRSPKFAAFASGSDFISYGVASR